MGSEAGESEMGALLCRNRAVRTPPPDQTTLEHRDARQCGPPPPIDKISSHVRLEDRRRGGMQRLIENSDGTLLGATPLGPARWSRPICLGAGPLGK